MIEVAQTLRSKANLAHREDVDTYVAATLGSQLSKQSHSPENNYIAFDTTQITHPENRSNPQPGDPAPTIAKDGHVPAVMATGVRRLTPRECERLQGFPDDYTAITYRGKPATDSPRYRAIGNSMAVNVMRWIGDRIKRVDDIIRRTD